MTTYVDAVIVEQVITRMEEAIARMIVNLDATIDRAFKRALAEFKTIEPELKSSEELHDPEIEETEAEIEDVKFEEAEIEVVAQASMDTETKVAVMKDRFQLKEPTKFEENERLLAQLDDVNSDPVKQLVAAQNHKHEVISKTLHVFDTCETLERICSILFVAVDKDVLVNDPYMFRLLVMGKRNHCILEQVLVRSLAIDAVMKEIIGEASKSQYRLEEEAVHMKNDFGEKLQRVCDALETVNLELVEEREKIVYLMKIKSSYHLGKKWTLRQKELDRYKKIFEESSRCQLQVEGQISQIDSDSERKLTEVCNALKKANFEVVEKIRAGHEIEFELWICKSIIDRLKIDLEESQELRKGLEAYLLVLVQVGKTIKQEKEGRIVNFQKQIVSLEKELNTRELEAVSSAKESILQITKEQDKIFKDFKKDNWVLEEESLRREPEGAAIAHIGAERRFEYEENLLQLVKVKYHRIEGLMQVAGSMEEDFNSSLNSFSLEIAEKQAQINLVNEAWEKIVRVEILAKLEIEEKKLIIVEFEDEVEEKFGGGTQSREIGNVIEEIGRHLFQTSHLFHQCSSHQLKSAFSRSSKDGVTLELDLVGASSPTLPQSVSRSRGKDYRSKKWKGNCHDISLNKIQPMKGLNGKPSLAHATLCKDDLRKELKMDPDLPTVLRYCWGSGILLGATHGVSIIGGKWSTTAWFITKVELLVSILEDKDVLKSGVLLQANLSRKKKTTSTHCFVLVVDVI